MKYFMGALIVLQAMFLLTIKQEQIAVSHQSYAKDQNQLHIYLLIGQSNMAGRAEISGNNADTLAGAFLYTDIPGHEWEKAANPLNKYSSIRKELSMQKLGPGYHFAKKILEFNTENPIGLVVNAKGGTSINEWEPSGMFYNEAVKRTKGAVKYGILKGILWHQGESDVLETDTYTSKIVGLIEALRTDFNSPDLPFIVGQLSEDKPQRILFNKMLLQLSSYIGNVGVVTSENTNTFDGTHFDDESQRIIGERYAREIYKLLNP